MHVSLKLGNSVQHSFLTIGYYLISSLTVYKFSTRKIVFLIYTRHYFKKFIFYSLIPYLFFEKRNVITKSSSIYQKKGFVYNEMLHGIMLDVVIKPTPFTKSL